jgi:hypothetical protein
MKSFELDVNLGAVAGVPAFGLSCDTLTDPRIRGLTATAFRAWVNAFAYCYESGRLDGSFPAAHLRTHVLVGRSSLVVRRAASELVAAGLWAETAERWGYSILEFRRWTRPAGENNGCSR